MSEIKEIQDSETEAPKSLWLTRLAWAISIVFNPIGVIALTCVWYINLKFEGSTSHNYEIEDILAPYLILMIFYFIPYFILVSLMLNFSPIRKWPILSKGSQARATFYFSFLSLLATIVYQSTGSSEYNLFGTRLKEHFPLNFFFIFGYVVCIVSFAFGIASLVQKFSLHLAGGVIALIVFLPSLFLDTMKPDLIPKVVSSAVLIVIIILLWWSRTYLRRETKWEIWSGAIVGLEVIIVSIVLFFLIVRVFSRG